MSLKRKAAEIALDASKKPKNASITSFFGAPKPNPPAASSTTTEGGKNATTDAAAEPAPVKFDKDAWVAKLSEEQKELLDLEIRTLHESWCVYLFQRAGKSVLMT